MRANKNLTPDHNEKEQNDGELVTMKRGREETLDVRTS
jgi:hypothetical protein